MIREGIDGSLCFFWKGKLMCSYPKVGNNIDEFFTQNAKNIIEQMIRQQGFTIKQQINHYKTICNDIHDRKNRKQGIWASDYELFGVAIYALRKLRYIDDDLHALDGICFFPPYKKSYRKFDVG